jgi:hypothetical protein
MSKSRFNLKPKQLRFLELYYQGYSMKDAARAAGYRGASDQALCNTGKAILDKFSNCPEALFLRVGARERKIAQLLVSLPDISKSQHEQLRALRILSRCFK